jgi:hypothetical protein
MQGSYFVYVDLLSEPMFDTSSNVTHSGLSQRGTSTLPSMAYLCGPPRNARSLLYAKQQYTGANIILSYLLKHVLLENEYITIYPLHSL